MSIGYCDRTKIEDIATTIRNAFHSSEKLTLAQINTKIKRIINDCTITEIKASDYTSNYKLDLSGMYIPNCTKIYGPEEGKSPTWGYITSVDFSGIVTEKLTSLYGLFWSCTTITEIDLSPLNLTTVTDMYNLFNNCTSLARIYGFNCDSAENMEYCFGSTLLTELPINEAPKATNIKGMFNSMTNITEATFSAPLATDCSELFVNCSNLLTADISVPLATNIAGMFAYYEWGNSMKLESVRLYAPSATTTYGSTWVGSVGLFEGCTQLQTVDLTVGALENATNMFSQCNNLSNITITFAKSGASASGMFSGLSSLTNLTLTGSSNLINTSSMFENCTGLTSIPTLDLTNVTNTSSMFSGCTQLQTVTTSSTQNTVKTTALANMFYNCSSLTTVDLTQLYVYTTGGTIDSSYFTDMFTGCTSLTTLTLPTNFGYWYYSTSTGASRTSKPTLDLSDCPLTHDSCLDVFNKLGKRSQTIRYNGYNSLVTGTLYLSDATYALMTTDEIAIATGKNWTVSTKTTT